MRLYLSLLLLIMLGQSAAAQQATPQYYVDKHPQGVGVPPYANQGITQYFEIHQCLLPADSFVNNPPYGRLKNIYLRTGYTWQPCKYYGINIELGHTAMTNLDTCTKLVTNLQLMAALDSLTTGDTVGEWIKIPLSEEKPFYFDPNQNLLLGIWLDTGKTSTGCYFLGSFADVMHDYLQIASIKNTAISNKFNIMYDFGFDLHTPTGIEDLSNLQAVSVYPNPAREKCTVSFSLQKPVPGCSIAVRDITGKELARHSYGASASGAFSQTIDIRLLPPGVYLLELRAGEERVTKKLVVQ